MALYEKIPIKIEAIQWIGTEKSTKEIYELLHGIPIENKTQISQDKFSDHVISLRDNGFKIQTPFGSMHAWVGDYIIKDHFGHISIVEEKDFNIYYRKVTHFN